MSVLVKGVEMPENCCICLFSSHDMCLVCGKDADDWLEERPEYCPLVELPDHGDLVDRDELMMKMWKASAYAPNHCSWVNARVVFAKDIEDAPVVIPAERSEDGET